MKIKIFFYQNSSFLIYPYLFFPILNVFIKVRFQQTPFSMELFVKEVEQKKKKINQK